jgi:hypothetical protein
MKPSSRRRAALWLLLVLLASPLKPARADDLSPSETELSEFERLTLPDVIYHDYLADRAAPGAKAAAVTARYRTIARSLDRMPTAKHDEYLARLQAARNKEDRDDLTDRYTGTGGGAPVKSIAVSNDDASLKLTFPKWHPTQDSSIGSEVKFGMIAPFGGTGDQNSVLRTSPYVQGALSAAYDGVAKAMLTATGSVVMLQSHKIFNDPTGNSSSNAGDLRTQTNFSQVFGIGSVYADAGTVAKFSDQLRAAFYAAGEVMVFSPTAGGSDDGNPAVPMISLTGGMMWMVKSARDEVTAFTDVRLQGISQDTKQFGVYTVSPGLGGGVEWAHDPTLKDRYAVGVEGSIQASDAALKPYVSVRSGDVSGLVAGDLRLSRNDAYPSTLGAGAKVGWQATPFMKVSLQGEVADQRYSMAPAPVVEYTGMTVLDFNIDPSLKFKASARLPDRYATADVVVDASRLNEHAAAAGYALDFKGALSESPNLGQFAQKIGAHDLDQMLSALSSLSYNLNKWNYDYSNTGWAGTDAQLYANARTSILSGTKNPDLQCVGAATFVAAVAAEMSRQSGIPVQAWASSVDVPSDNGTQDHHFVTMLKTAKYGIVFLDWGQLTPTYEFSTKRALAIFQGLQGIPSIAHYIADNRGHFGGYLFSDDGKVLVENLTYHAQLPGSEVDQVLRADSDPNVAGVVEGRAKKWLQNQP